MLDSGGFTELERYGEWTITNAAYVREVRRYQEEIGRLQWAPVCDWMCEPWILERTGKSVSEHQALTTRSYLQLQQAEPEIPWVPVLQGWQRDDYLRHRDWYGKLGVDLERLPVVGLGSVCRRQHTKEAEAIVRALQPLRLHGFGVKIDGLSRFAHCLVSADSMAWSIGARHRPAMYPECSHRNCASCVRWALEWRSGVVERLEWFKPRPWQFQFEDLCPSEG